MQTHVVTTPATAVSMIPRMESARMAHMRAALLIERSKELQIQQRLKDKRDRGQERQSDPSDGTRSHDDARDFRLIQDSAKRLIQIEAALARVDRGTYGICEDCGDEISTKRLDARPFASTCKDCKEAAGDKDS